MASWYRRFIDNYAKISEPLNQLTQKSRRLKWGEEQQKAMDTLKETLMTALLDFDIQHRKGSLHYVPDALSRMFEDESEGLNAITETNDTWYDKELKR